MADYQQIFQFLEVPQLVLEVIVGEVQLPLDLTVPFRHCGFPPALLPLWSTGTIYHGYWKHWLTPRKTTLVEMDVAQKRQTSEIARDFPQIIREMTLFDICWNESITSTLRISASQTGISDQELEHIEQAILVSGDHPSGWLTLPEFMDDPPLPCVPSGHGYHGDFPHDNMVLTPASVRNICTFEVSDYLHQRIAALPFVPPWFVAEEQAPIFERLLQQGDLAGAWMSLNSTGWQFQDAKDAMRSLAERVDIAGFNLLADAWISEAHGATLVTTDTRHY